MKDNKLFLIIKTNEYVGNFERELMGYVFGFDKDGYSDDEINIFEKEMDGDIDFFDNYLDTFAFGEHDGEYSCYTIGSHPSNAKYNCDSFYICLKQKFPDAIANVALKRLVNFCEYIKKKYNTDVKILDIDYYQNKFVKLDEENLSL